MSGDVTAIAGGETRAVAVALDAVPGQRFCVVDVGEELLPHLVVRGRRTPMSAGVRLDADGRGELRSSLVEDAPFLSGDDDVALVASRRPAALVGYLAGEAWLRPAEPVVGVQLRAPDGALVPFWLDLHGSPHGPAMHTETVHVIERQRLDKAAVATVWSEATGSLRVPSRAWVGHDDLVVLDARAGETAATVQVTGSGERPLAGVEVELLDAAGQTMRTQECPPGAATTTILGIGPGTYDLRWRLADSAKNWIARDVVLAAGERREFSAPWPRSIAWSGAVAGLASLPPRHRFHSLRFGSSDSLEHRGARLPLDRDGCFSFELSPDAQPDGEAVLFAAMMGVPTKVAGIDANAHRIVVALPEGLHWVDLDVALPRRAPWIAFVVRADRLERPWMIVRNDDRRPLLVPPGVVLAGVLVDGHGFGDGDHAIAWFRADGTQPVVRVAPVGGHWVALSGPPTSWAQAIGPDGVHGPWVQPGADGRAQLWVPDGTMSVRSGRNNKTEIETTDHSPVVDHLELR